MSKNAEIILYHTSGTTSPSSSNMELGEVAVSHDNDLPKLFTKKNNGTIAEFVDKVYVDDRTTIPIVEKGTSDTTFTLKPDIFYIWDEVSLLTLDLEAPETTDELHVYMFQFKSLSDGTTSLSLPSDIIWAGSVKIESDKTYQVTIVNNVAIMAGAAPHIVSFNLNIQSDIGTAVTSSNQAKTYTVYDNDEYEHTFTIVGNTGGTGTASQWRVTTGTSVTYVVDSKSYTNTAYLEFRGAGSSTYQNISVSIDGPCTITIAGTATATGRSLTVIAGTTTTSNVCSVTTANSVVVESVEYTGNGGTLTIYPSAAYKIYDIKIKYAAS